MFNTGRLSSSPYFFIAGTTKQRWKEVPAVGSQACVPSFCCEVRLVQQDQKVRLYNGCFYDLSSINLELNKKVDRKENKKFLCYSFLIPNKSFMILKSYLNLSSDQKGYLSFQPAVHYC